MVRIVVILILVVVACLALAGRTVLAQGPPEQENDGEASSGKNDSNISQLLLEAIGERGRTGAQTGTGTKDTASRDTSGGQRSASANAGSPASTRGEDLQSGVSKDGSETSRDYGDLVRFDDDGNVQVYIHLASTDEASLQQVRDAVEQVEIENTEHGLIQAWVDPDELETLANLDTVKRIGTPDYGHTKKGSKLTEGDAVHRANLVRAFSGLTGEGMKVGVIADGADAWTSARDTGDLPSSIEINPNQESNGHEGTALMEIIHDIAPDAELAFSGIETSLGMAQAILWLANDAFDGEGADVIVDDIGFWFQPYFEDGIIAQAAEDVVEGGTVYVTAAGNAADNHYEGQFSNNGDNFHAFDGSSDISMRLRVPLIGPLILQWNDEWGASDNDYDLYVCPAGLEPTEFNLYNGICDASTDHQDGDDYPVEFINVIGFEVDVYIEKYGGQDRRLEMFFYGSTAR